MNQQRYRLVFNRVRGCCMAVAEVAKSVSAGGASGERNAGVRARRQPLCAPLPGLRQSLIGYDRWAWMLVLAALGMGAAQAQIVADKRALGLLQPTVLSSASGVPIVNITTPNAGSISHNVYSQFDVGSVGAILNNARTMSTTQLAGWIAANPWLAQGSARLILNEIRSSQPSHLGGYLEVAGPKTDVIVANPSGLSINGSGFINAGNVTLTSATPSLQNGSVNLSVQGGTMAVTGQGLDNRNSDYTRLLSGKLDVNGGIWAPQLEVRTGAAEYSQNGTVQSRVDPAIAATGAAAQNPSWAIDVGQLGGMYAGKIVLQSSQAGAGVRNAGSVGATAAGFEIDVDGRIVNTGNMISNSSAVGNDGSRIQARALHNSGNISSAGDIRLDTSAEQINSGLISAAHALRSTSTSLDNSAGRLQAGGLYIHSQALNNHAGRIEQSGSQALNVYSQELRNRSGQIGQALLAPAAATPFPVDRPPPAGPTDTPAPSSLSSQTQEQPPAPSLALAPLANGHIRIDGVFDNGSGSLLQSGVLSLNSEGISNTAGGNIRAQQLQVQGPTDNTGSTLQAVTLSLSGGPLNNDRGHIQALQSLTIDSQHHTVRNTGGSLSSGATLRLSSGTAAVLNASGSVQSQQLTLAAGSLDNSHGRIVADKAVQIDIAGNSNNTSGHIASNGSLDLNSGAALTNDHGSIQSLGELRLSAASIASRGGKIQSNADMSILSKGGTFDSSGGQIGSTTALTIDTQGAALINDAGRIAAQDVALNVGALANRDSLESGGVQGHRLTLRADSLDNSRGRIVAEKAAQLQVTNDSNNTSGHIASNGSLDLNSGAALTNHGGSIQSQGELRLSAASIASRGGKIQSNADMSILSKGGTFDSSGGQIGSTTALTIDTQGAALINDAGRIAAQDVTLNVGALANRDSLDGGGVQGHRLTLRANSLDNSRGRIAAEKSARLQVTNDSNNTSGHIASNGSLDLNSGAALTNHGGSIQSQGELRLSAASIASRGGKIQSNTDMNILSKGGTFDSSGGQIGSATALTIDTQGAALINDAGRIAAQDVTLNVGALANRDSLDGGGVQGHRLTLRANSLDNSRGRIAAEKSARLQVTNDSNNTSGHIASNGTLNINTGTTLVNNDRGSIQSQGELRLSAASIASRGGKIQSNADMSILSKGGTFDSSGGQIGSATALTIDTQGAALINDAGRIAAQDVTLNVGALANRDSLDGGGVQGHRLTLRADSLDNSRGRIVAEKAAQIDIAGNSNNTSGHIASNGTLNINTGTTLVNNDKGSIQSQGELRLSAASIASRGGKIQSNRNATITSLRGPLDNTGGQIGSTTALTIDTQGAALINDAGRIAAQDVTLNVGALANRDSLESGGVQGHRLALRADSLDNSRGRIVADKAAQLQVTNDSNNTSGHIASNGRLDLNTGAALTSSNGSIQSLGDLTVQAASVGNQSGKIQSNNNATITSLRGPLDNTGGQISSTQNLAVNTNGAALNNEKGQIAAQDLTVDAGALDNRDTQTSGGLQGQTLVVHVSKLDNSSGRIAAEKSAQLDVTNATINSSGHIASNGTLNINTGTALVNNDKGSIQSQGELRLSAASIASRGGKIQSNADMSILSKGGTLDSSGGQIGSATALTIDTQGAALINDAGRIAAQDVTLNVGALANRDSLESGGVQGHRLALHADSLDNSRGRIAAEKSARLQVTNDSNNTSGHIASNGTLNINTGTTLVNNDRGSIQSQGELRLSAASIASRGGDIQSNAAASVTSKGGTLDSSGGQIGSATVLTIDTQGAALINDAGRIAAQDVTLNVGALANRDSLDGGGVQGHRLTLHADSLDNSRGRIVAKQSAQLQVTNDSNNTSGHIASNGRLNLNTSAALTNHSGSIQSLGDLTVQAASVGNQSGKIQSNNNATITSLRGPLDNTGGQISSTQNLAVNTNGATLNNEKGQIAAQDLTLSAGALDNRDTQTSGGLQGQTLVVHVSKLDNSRGRIAAEKSAQLDVTNATINTSGHIASNGTLNINTGTTLVNNDKGSIQSLGDLKLDTGGDTNNTSGHIASNGSLDLNSGAALTNHSGSIQSLGELRLSAASIASRSGKIQSNAATSIQSKGGTLDNSGGQIGSATVLTIDTQGAALINDAGRIAAQDVTLNVGALANRDSLESGGVQGHRLALRADSLDNSRGRIVADKAAQIDIAGNSNNSGGHIASNGSLDLNSGAALTNTAGRIESGDDLHLRSRSLSGDGIVDAGRTADIALVDSYRHSAQGVLEAQRHLHLVTQGELLNGGKIQSAGDMQLSAARVDNIADSQILSNGQTRIDSSGDIVNRGSINGQYTVLHSGSSVRNIGAGRIYGNQIAIEAQHLENREETVNGITKAAVIASRGDLDIGVQTLTNQEHALISSAANLRIGGALDAHNYATGRSQSIDNLSARIESDAAMELSAQTLNNRNLHMELNEISKLGEPYTARKTSSGLVKSADVAWETGTNWETTANYLVLFDSVYAQDKYKQWYDGVDPIVPAYRHCDENENCDTVPTTAYHYDASSSIWRDFDVAPPETKAPLPEPAANCKDDVVDDAICRMLGRSTEGEIAAWKKSKAPWEQLQEKITAMRKAVEAGPKVDPDAAYYDLTDTVRSEEFTDKAKDSVAKIISGEDMTLDVSDSAVNNDSEIVAGGRLAMLQSKVLNDGTKPQITTYTYGTEYYTLTTTPCGWYRWRYKCRPKKEWIPTPYSNSTTVSQDQVLSHVKEFTRVPRSNEVQTRSGSSSKPPDAQQLGAVGMVDPTARAQNTGASDAPSPTGVSDHAALAPANLASTGRADAASVRAAAIASAAALAKTAAADRAAIASDAPAASATVADTALASAAAIASVAPAASATVTSTPPAASAALVASADVTAATLDVVRRTAGSFPLPQSSLYLIHPNSGNYLVETDPQFTQRKQFLSSDYLLRQLQYDPQTMLKRMGDGYYERKLVQDQILGLIGQRFLADYRNDDAQYQALMDAGVSFARAHQLRPGIVLTAQQLAHLTSDMVWLETQSVTLADGSTQQVLVPRVYVRARRGDIAPVGGLLAGNSVVGTVRELKNSGTIAGRTVVQITADHQLHTGLVRGQDIALHSKNDMLLQGAQIRADKSLNLKAGRDLKIETTTSSSTSSAGSNRFSHTGLDRVATLYAGNSLSLQAGQDLKLTAAQVNSDGTLSAKAGRDLKLDTVNTAQSETLNWSGKGYDLQRARSSSQDVGSVLNAKGDVQLRAGNDIDLQAAQVSSQAQLSALAGGNINIAAGQATQSDYDYEHKTSKSLFSRSSSTKIRQSDSQSTVASTIEGHSVLMKAGQDVNVKGSNVLADAALQLSAGRDVNILAAEEKQRSSYFEETKKSGLMGSGGIGFTIGKRQQSLDQQGTQTTAAASTVGSLGGNVSIIAGQKYTQSGSDVLAPKGDIDILAKKVDITEAQESATSRTEQKMKQSGLTVTLTSPIISTAQGVQQMAQAAQQTKSSRMQGLAAAAAGLSVYNNAKGIAQSVEALAKGDIKGAGFKLSVALGASQSQSVQTSASSSARGSTVKAGGNVNILATGAGQDSDLTLQGSSISAGKNALLYADDAIALKAAENRHSQASSNRSTSGSIGLSLDAQGISLDIAANRGQGNGDGSGTSYSNSQVSAANTLTLRSGGDTLLQGAVAKARRVVADVGGDLKIESLQDRSQYQEKQSSQGLSVSIPVTGTGKFGASVSASQANIRSNYQSAAAQSGIQAGDGGFSVDVQGNTSLIGGAITSTQKALDLQQNHFATKGALTLHDLENKAQYSANSVGGNLGMGSQKGGSAGIGQDSGNAKSLTTAGISGIAGDAAKRTGDAQQGIAPIFDKDAVRADVQAQVQITQMFGQNASKAVGDYSQSKRQALQQQLKKASTEAEKQKIEAQINDINLQERVMNVLVGAVSGFGATALTKETLSAAADQMRQLMIEDSKKFAGVTDGTTELDNISGPSEGVRGDGRKIGGARVNLDVLCGVDNSRCETNNDGSLALNSKGQVRFNPEAAGVASLAQFLETPEGKKLSGPTGGIQGAEGTLFGMPYKPGGLTDKLIESFSGSHDMIGGKLSGLYDDQGNLKRGMTKTEKILYERWSEVAIPLSTPFAMSEVLPPEVWKAISIFLGAAK